MSKERGVKTNRSAVQNRAKSVPDMQAEAYMNTGSELTQSRDRGLDSTATKKKKKKLFSFLSR